MDFIQLSKARKKHLRVPSTFYEDWESSHYFMPVGETNDHDSWVTARFSPHQSQDHILYMGDDPGNIGVFDVRRFQDWTLARENRQVHFFPAHEGAIMDIVGVPHKESQIVSISGDSTVRCWDLNQNHLEERDSQLFSGHEGSVRSICFAPEDSNVFVTGARDGQVKVWDMRVSAVKKNEEEFRLATVTYKTAHPSSQVEKPTPGTPKSKGRVKYVGSSVTSVVFLDEFHLASASSSAESGIRIWDIRRPTRNGEGQPARVLKVPTNKQRSFGVTCLAVDRFGNRLFASCTNSTIFEYSVPTTNCSPINSYTGATIRDYYTQVACSPISDVIACGSEDCRALLWDLQDQYTYQNDTHTADLIDKRRTKLPRWSTGGHLRKVQNVGFSAQGQHFLTFDEGGVRVWNASRRPWKCVEEEGPYAEEPSGMGLSMERIKRFEMTEPDAAMSCIDSISLTPRSSPQKGRGVKRAIASSPFKVIASSPKPLRLLTHSPSAKISKLSSSPSHHLPLQPTNSNSLTPRHRSKRRKNPFYYEHPTENLPNFVYDTFIRKMTGKEADGEESKSLSKTSRKRIEDWWQGKAAENLSTVNRARLPSVSEFGESACSKVMAEDERIAMLSPRKLVLKTASSPCPSTPKTMPMTPRKPADKRPTSRNLLHYFKASQ